MRQTENVLADHHEMVERFNKEIAGTPIPEVPTKIEGPRKDFCTGVLREEIKEFEDATTLAEQADAIVDLLYYAHGRLLEMGVVGRAAFEEVHAANMRKVRGELSKRPHALGFDAVKPAGWQGPDVETLLRFGLRDLRRVKPKPKLIVLGYARHGKDTVCEMLRDEYGYSFTASSVFCAERVVFPTMRDRYQDARQCFEDRHSGDNRARWYDAISRYNEPDPSRLARDILAEHDIYCGLRSSREFFAARNAGAFYRAIWVDRSWHAPEEALSSCTVKPWMADHVLDNNGSLDDLRFGLRVLIDRVESEYYDAPRAPAVQRDLPPATVPAASAGA